VGHAPVLQRNVEIHPDENPLAPDVAEVLERPQGQREAPMRPTRSTIRLENPHSLSYQPITLTSVPLAMVDNESKMHECAFPTMSLETIGSSVYSRIPCSRSLSDATLKAWFT